MLLRTTVGALLAVAASSLANAAVTSVDLSNYTLTGTHNLPSGAASEASSITWNWDTDTLFTLGDEGTTIVQVTKTGQMVDSMSLSGFLDTEGMTYIGNGQFVVTEERRQQAFLLTYTAGGAVNKTALQGASLGANLGDGGGGNIGIEGISYDPRTGTFVVVKEKSPQAVNQASINFPAGTASVTSLFNPAALGVTDLSDVQVLATVPSLLGGPDADNLLVFSQESRRLLEVTRTGTVLSFFDLPLVGDAEGVTVDGDGNIYIVDEIPRLFVLTPNAPPVPLPAAAWLLLSGVGVVVSRVRRRKHQTITHPPKPPRYIHQAPPAPAAQSLCASAAHENPL
jgi:uncharacterized protein YjiK